MWMMALKRSILILTVMMKRNNHMCCPVERKIKYSAKFTRKDFVTKDSASYIFP